MTSIKYCGCELRDKLISSTIKKDKLVDQFVMIS
jgi:hypothetical protein